MTVASASSLFAKTTNQMLTKLGVEGNKGQWNSVIKTALYKDWYAQLEKATEPEWLEARWLVAQSQIKINYLRRNPFIELFKKHKPKGIDAKTIKRDSVLLDRSTLFWLLLEGEAKLPEARQLYKSMRKRIKELASEDSLLNLNVNTWMDDSLKGKSSLQLWNEIKEN